MSNRSLFLVGMLLGVTTAIPGWAFAKGQWCNDTNLFQRATLTLQSVTLAGAAQPLPTGAAYDVTSRASGSGAVSAHLYCGECQDSTTYADPLDPAP